MGWSIKNYKLYRTSIEEEKLMMEKEFYGEEENADEKEIDPESFDATLKKNMTPFDLNQYRFKNFHYAYICRKPIPEETAE
jgi:hypothetical protein